MGEGGRIDSAVDSESIKRSGFEPWPGSLRCVHSKTLLSLSIQVHKWVPTTLVLGVTLR